MNVNYQKLRPGELPDDGKKVKIIIIAANKNILNYFFFGVRCDDDTDLTNKIKI